MRVFEELCPAPPHWTVPWEEIRDAFAWVRDMAGVPQDAVYHGEGDVEVHTRMACEALAAMPRWRARPAGERVRLFTTVLMHDIAKPSCTATGDDGRITARGHSRRGDLMVRRILWELGAPVGWREHVAALIRHHQVPFWALERPDLQQIAFRVSLLARNDDLVLLASADILGRICPDTDELLDNVALYGEYCAEQDCLDGPRAFPSDHARFWYFRKPGRDPGYAAYDDTRCTATVLSGLPGVGKDHWIAANRPDLPVVSLDRLRAELGVDPAGDQRAVAAAAHELARGHLRAGRSFVWNATNVSRTQRDLCAGLVAAYRGRVEMVALEAPPRVVRDRNRARTSPVPDAVIDRLVRRWETPDPTEAHRVHWLSTA
ncbi:poly(A) polymerase [Actinomadura darangshiensis]|uniref:Poly(A) polymerase n=1 Tax=Actinomadura darangshiensis TaxID=705336 RepID=A0A4R5BK81_9ACTN|nr:AAA family ATPase [Actinomadura darangshiensis]TDD87198.1 poly(A) polymerase [Actinomadura darangshiensis]